MAQMNETAVSEITTHSKQEMHIYVNGFSRCKVNSYSRDKGCIAIGIKHQLFFCIANCPAETCVFII
jgi:hypothetical protein